MSIRGNGKGERKLHERIYDYDVYNDLGNPDKSEDLARPLVGGKEKPYPRRCRTGRGPTKTGTEFCADEYIFHLGLLPQFCDILIPTFLDLWMLKDPLAERRIEKPHPVYVPRDETFEEIKQNTFSAGRLKALLHNLVPLIAATLSSSDIPFTNFTDIDKLYKDGVVLNDDNDQQKNKFLSETLDKVFSVSKRLLKYEIPAIIRRKHTHLLFH